MRRRNQEQKVAIEFAKRRRRIAALSIYFIILFFILMLGRLIVDQYILLIGASLVFALLTLRIIIIDRYYILKVFAPLFLMMATSIGLVLLAMLGLFSFSVTADFMAENDALSVAVFLGILFSAVALGMTVYFKVGKNISDWADSKQYENLRRTIK